MRSPQDPQGPCLLLAEMIGQEIGPFSSLPVPCWARGMCRAGLLKGLSLLDEEGYLSFAVGFSGFSGINDLKGSRC